MKVVLLGGGPGALAAAWELSEDPDVEVDLYTLGWRLGGKGASSRDPRRGDRIIEQGMHGLLGYYAHTHRLMEAAYEALEGPPFPSWEAALRPLPHVTVMEHHEGRWLPWHLAMPHKHGKPSDVEGDLPRPIELLASALPGLGELLGVDPTRLVRVTDEARRGDLLGVRRALGGLADAAWNRLGDSVWNRTELRRAWMALDLTVATLRGLLADSVSTRGFDHLDDEDLLDWLRRHGAHERTLASGLVKGLYDLVFAYRDGDLTRPALSAGVGLKGALRMFLTYQGAFLSQLRAGMGETMMAPLHEALRQRGVRFHFFHRIRHLALSEDGRRVERIDLGIQATVRKEPYEPLVESPNMKVWPVQPLWDQLIEPDEGLDLEAGDGPDVARLSLERGKGFDQVVLAIPPGALPPICTELVAAHEPWRRLLEHTGLVATIALQVWFQPDTRTLGWEDPGTVLSGYRPPFASWGDYSHMLPREHWPPHAWPGHASYAVGVLSQEPGAEEALPAAARAWLESATELWPEAFDEQGLRWDLLIDLEDREGADRFEAQVVRANTHPCDLYVQSLPGTLRYRLAPEGSGLDNLWLAGDWTRNGLDLGTMEAAIRSGERAARGALIAGG